jgi:N-acetylglucosamine kinase-like BadF-type ATPase
MKLIADSGSTKCQWALCGGGSYKILKTKGLNPYFCSPQEIQKEVIKHILPNLKEDKAEQIFFFGAGCRAEKIETVENALQKVFPYARIAVNSDLMWAAVALFGESRGIACILGTGSNSGLYNGKEIVQNVPALGYILGDEGSGAVLGKRFIGDLLKNQIPVKISKKFFKKYSTHTDEIIENVYGKPAPNRYLAGFCPFLKANLTEPYIYNLVFDCFTDFFTRNILQYPDYNQYTISFCGSVACNFADVLEVSALELGLNCGKIIQSPIEELAKFYV